MKSKFAIVAVFLLMFVTIVVLWSRVNSLESKINSLTAQLQSYPGTFRIGQFKADDQAHPAQPKKSPFKLIDSAEQSNRDEGTSSIGVPWSVESAMMGGAKENAVPMRKQDQDDAKLEAAPTPPLIPASK